MKPLNFDLFTQLIRQLSAVSQGGLESLKDKARFQLFGIAGVSSLIKTKSSLTSLIYTLEFIAFTSEGKPENETSSEPCWSCSSSSRRRRGADQLVFHHRRLQRTHQRPPQAGGKSALQKLQPGFIAAAAKKKGRLEM